MDLNLYVITYGFFRR